MASLEFNALTVLFQQARAGHKIGACLVKADTNCPQVIVISQDGSLDEVRFGVHPLSISEREIQKVPSNFKWADYKRWEVCRDSKFKWESRGQTIERHAALAIWRALEIGYAA